jgi:hypothetical protein
MENALAENNTALQKELARLEKDTGELLRALTAEKIGVPAEAAGDSAGLSGGPSPLPPDFPGLCERLEPLLKSGNTESLSYLEAVKKIPPPLDGEGKILVKQIEDFDFSAALETLRDIQRKAEKGGGRHG